MRNTVDKTRIVGFAEKIINSAGADQVIDLKAEFGPIFEEFMRTNKWLEQMSYQYADQMRTVYKTQYKAIKDNTKDFNYQVRNTGGTVKPEEEVILMTTTKDVSCSFYAKDFEQSNALQTVAGRILQELFIVPNEIIDEAIAAKYAEAAEANSTTVVVELDVDAMEMTAANGEIVYGAIANLAENFKKSAATNEYHRGSKFRNEEIKIVVSTKVDELMAMFKAGYIDQSGLLNSGMFGERFRNISIRVMEEMPTGYHVFIYTDRAIQGTIEAARHTKFIDESQNQTGYTTEANNVFGFGFKRIFENEVTGIKQTGTAAPTYYTITCTGAGTGTCDVDTSGATNYPNDPTCGGTDFATCTALRSATPEKPVEEPEEILTPLPEEDIESAAKQLAEDEAKEEEVKEETPKPTQAKKTPAKKPANKSNKK